MDLWGLMLCQIQRVRAGVGGITGFQEVVATNCECLEPTGKLPKTTADNREPNRLLLPFTAIPIHPRNPLHPLPAASRRKIPRLPDQIITSAAGLLFSTSLALHNPKPAQQHTSRQLKQLYISCMQQPRQHDSMEPAAGGYASDASLPLPCTTHLCPFDTHTHPSNLLQAILMMFNSVAILNNDRFLERCEFLLLLPQCSNADSWPLGDSKNSSAPHTYLCAPHSHVQTGGAFPRCRAPTASRCPSLAASTLCTTFGVSVLSGVRARTAVVWGCEVSEHRPADGQRGSPVNITRV